MQSCWIECGRSRLLLQWAIFLLLHLSYGKTEIVNVSSSNNQCHYNSFVSGSLQGKRILEQALCIRVPSAWKKSIRRTFIEQQVFRECKQKAQLPLHVRNPIHVMKLVYIRFFFFFLQASNNRTYSTLVFNLLTGLFNMKGPCFDGRKVNGICIQKSYNLCCANKSNQFDGYDGAVSENPQFWWRTIRKWR